MQSDAQQNYQRYPNQPPRSYKLMLWCLLFALLAIILWSDASAQDDSTRYGFSVGLVSTNWEQMASAGLVQQTSPHWAKFAFADIGGGLASFQAQGAVLFPISPAWSIAFFVGPEVSIYQKSPTLEEKLIYISAAQGIGAYIKLPPRASLLISAEYIKSDAPISRYRLGLRGILWLN